jgi:hypothetical protein
MFRRRTPDLVEDVITEAEKARAVADLSESQTRIAAAAADAAQITHQAKLDQDAATQKARIDAQERDQRAAAKRALAAEKNRKELHAVRGDRVAAQKRQARQAGAERGMRAARTAFSIGVNTAAWFGQFGYLHDQVAAPLVWSALIAALLELAAVSAQAYATAAAIDGDRVLPKLILSYLFAGVVAWLNYSHWTQTPGREGLAIPFALMSIASPIFWQMHSAHAHRDERRAARDNRRADKEARRAAKGVATFSVWRWIFWPMETLRAQRIAIRFNEPNPEVAVDLSLDYLAEQRAERERQAAIRAHLDAARQRQGLLSWFKRPPLELEAGEQQLQDDELDEDAERELDLPDVPSPHELADMNDREIKKAARATYRAANQQGLVLTGLELGAAYERSESWGRTRIREVKGQVIPGETIGRHAAEGL